MAKKDYYKLLGIKRNASEQEVKRAYRRLARKHHPDVNPGDKSAETKFKDINEAYEVLSDKENRKKYDQFGDNWHYADQFTQGGNMGQQSVHWDFPSGNQGIHFNGDDLESLFGNLFQGARAGTFNRKPRPRKGRNLEYPVEVTLEEVYNGASRILNLQSEQACPSCGGIGQIHNAICSVCRGSGATSEIKQLEVKIPPGVKDGSRVRIAGKGEPGYAGGNNGDLYLKTSVKTHRLFKRKGDDLHSEVSVPLTVAVLGGEIQVPTLKGNLALTIPSETQNGRAFRLSGQGMPHLGKSSCGDLMTKVKVVLPTNLSKEEKELFEQFSKLHPES